MAEQIDINEEYKKIFGVETRENIFSADDEKYNNLRQEIIDAKREFNFKKSLPFEGVQLFAYEDFKRHEVVHFEEKQGFRIFYIRNYRNSKLVTYGAGYFNPNDSNFYVLKDCFFEESSYLKYLSSITLGLKRLNFIGAYRKDCGTLVEKRLHMYESASLAASYYIGKKTTFREWKDDRGKTLDAYYSKYKASNIDEMEEKTFPNYVTLAPSHVVPEPTPSNIRHRNITEGIPWQKTVKDEPKDHLFYLRQDLEPDRFCDAKGWYDPNRQFFIIKAGSVISREVAPLYKGTAFERSRSLFIQRNCILQNNKLVILNDVTINSPTMAACHVTGRVVKNRTIWTDCKGKTINDIYGMK